MSITISELKDNLSYIIKPGIKQTITPIIKGRPGVGKSDAVRQLCEQLTEQTGKEYQFIDLRLSQLESSDLRGIPVPDLEANVARWLPPEFLPFESVKKFENTQGIILLDEMNRARTDVLQAAFQLVLDRQVGLHKLLDSWFLIAAGNLGFEDGTDVNEFDTALNNRFIHFHVDCGLDSWLEWARAKGLHPDVIGFVESKPNMLYYTVKEEAEIFVTPRSWEKFSDILQANPKVDPKVLTLSIGSAILDGVAGHFNKYLETKEIISPKDIVEKYKIINESGEASKKSSIIKKKVKVLSREQIHSLNSELVAYIAKNYSTKMAKKKKSIFLENVFGYCKEILEKDIYIAFMQSLTKACNAIEGKEQQFIDDYLKTFQSESALVIQILSAK